MLKSFTMSQAPWLNWHLIWGGTNSSPACLQVTKIWGLGGFFGVCCVCYCSGVFLGRKYFIFNISSFVFSTNVHSKVFCSAIILPLSKLWYRYLIPSFPKVSPQSFSSVIYCMLERLLWKQWYAGIPFHTDALFSVDINVRVVRYLYNFNTEIWGFFRFFILTLFLSSLSSHLVHEIINVVWAFIQEKALSSTFTLFSLCMRNFFPLALLWAISHNCILAKLFHEAPRIYWVHVFIFFPSKDYLSPAILLGKRTYH